MALGVSSVSHLTCLVIYRVSEDTLFVRRLMDENVISDAEVRDRHPRLRALAVRSEIKSHDDS
jgi:hypothetical protein